MSKRHFSRVDFGSWGVSLGILGASLDYKVVLQFWLEHTKCHFWHAQIGVVLAILGVPEMVLRVPKSTLTTFQYKLAPKNPLKTIISSWKVGFGHFAIVWFFYLIFPWAGAILSNANPLIKINFLGSNPAGFNIIGCTDHFLLLSTSSPDILKSRAYKASYYRCNCSGQEWISKRWGALEMLEKPPTPGSQLMIQTGNKDLLSNTNPPSMKGYLPEDRIHVQCVLHRGTLSQSVSAPKISRYV